MDKICVRIIADNRQALLDQLQRIEFDHDFFELRLDYLSDLNIETIKKVLDAKKSRVIATIRTNEEGGEFSDDDDEYSDLVRACLDSGADYVDVELAKLEKLPKLAKNDPKRMIVSYHNFNLTPDDTELEAIINRMQQIAPGAIRKIACMANTMEDVERLSNLLKVQTEDSSIIIAMGEKGHILRLLGPGMGSFATFAEAEDSPDNGDRMYYKKMQKLLEAMEKTDGRQ